MVDLARREEALGHDQAALDDYNLAVDYDPNNQQAVQGRDAILAKMGRLTPEATGRTPLDKEAVPRQSRNR